MNKPISDLPLGATMIVAAAATLAALVLLSGAQAGCICSTCFSGSVNPRVCVHMVSAFQRRICYYNIVITSALRITGVNKRNFASIRHIFYSS